MWYYSQVLLHRISFRFVSLWQFILSILKNVQAIWLCPHQHLRFISFDHSLSLGSKTLNPNLHLFLFGWSVNWELGDGAGGEVGWGNRELLRIAPSSSCPKSRLLLCSAPHSRASLSHRPPLVRLLVRRHLHFLPLRNWGTTHFLSLQLNFASFSPFCAHKLSLKNNTIPSCLLSLFRILWIECCIHYLILVHKWVSIKNRKLSYWNWTQGFIYIYGVVLTCERHMLECFCPESTDTGRTQWYEQFMKNDNMTWGVS